MTLDRQSAIVLCLAGRYGITVAFHMSIFLWFEHLMLVLACLCSFKMVAYSRPLFGVQHEEKEMQTISPTLLKEQLIVDDFIRDIDSHNHALNPVSLEKKPGRRTLPFMVNYERWKKRQKDQ